MPVRGQGWQECKGEQRVCAAGTDAFLLESIFRNEAWGHMMEPVSKENEANVCDSMVAGCEAALDAFTASLSDDLRALGELGDDTSARAVALRVRTVRSPRYRPMLDVRAATGAVIWDKEGGGDGGWRRGSDRWKHPLHTDRLPCNLAVPTLWRTAPLLPETSQSHQSAVAVRPSAGLRASAVICAG